MVLVPCSDKDICDYEESEALVWKQPTQEIPGDRLVNRNGPVSTPDMTWMIPPRSNQAKIMMHLKRIESKTNTHMAHNEDDGQIDMWGDTEDLEEALIQWNICSKNMHEMAKQHRESEKKNKKQGETLPKEPAWAKPDKVPSNKVLREKKERRKERKRKENVYIGKPEEPKLFNGFFMIPDTDISIELIIGKKNEILRPISINTKCNIWYDELPELQQFSNKIIKIAGDTQESVEAAIFRVKNLFIKTLSSRDISKGLVLHMIEPPSKPYKIRITDPPHEFYLPYDRLVPKLVNDQEVPLKYKLLEAVYEGEKIQVVGREAPKELRPSYDVNSSQKKRETNFNKIKESFLKALETIHLSDEEIKMRIRFGRVYLITDKDFDRNTLLPIKKLTSNILSKSKFATCIAEEREQLNHLFEELTDNNRQWNGSPFREFKIRTSRKTSDEEGLPPCVFEVQFKKDIIEKDGGNIKYDGKIGLWNVVIRPKNILDINLLSLDNDDYSWKLNIQTAKRLPNDRSCPQGKFVDGLRICQKGRLVYSNTSDITVASVCEKTKWKYWWKEDYVVEITKYEYWILSKYMKNIGIEVHLDKKKAKVSFGVTFYKKSWEDEFALNRDLGVGEVPGWHPQDIMDEGPTFFDDLKEFLKLLQEKLPMPNSYN
ncbi:hypothetical protein C1645_880390 [Glomus cerebriforme]|uniref:Uncharacterized protein n=1 Tax=Glomus cerebriforme TaxID=658196 RepID=A0A397SHB3_9GLOM|nr:hypothetical protein C1645_880390 [Glomus cerebriforme]